MAIHIHHLKFIKLQAKSRIIPSSKRQSPHLCSKVELLVKIIQYLKIQVLTIKSVSPHLQLECVYLLYPQCTQITILNSLWITKPKFSLQLLCRLQDALQTFNSSDMALIHSLHPSNQKSLLPPINVINSNDLHYFLEQFTQYC